MNNHWSMMADNQEVFNVLNSIGMELESFHYVKESEYGQTIRQHHFNDNTFFKAEQVWAQREKLA